MIHLWNIRSMRQHSSALQFLPLVVLLIPFATTAHAAVDLYVDNTNISTPLDPFDSAVATHDYGIGRTGTSPSTPMWSIQHAVSQAQFGDTIYVLATDIAYGHFSVTTNGLTIVGHASSSLTDLDDGSGVPADYDDATTASETSQPLIKGYSTAYLSDAEGSGLYLNGVYEVVVRNFNIKECRMGVHVGDSDTCQVKNIFTFDLGTKTSSAGAGYGIVINGGSTLVTITDCVVYNATYAGIEIDHSDGNTILGSAVYADDNSSPTITPTDYYFGLVDASYNNIVECFAGRYDELDHFGHGFALRAYDDDGDTCAGNNFTDVSCLNMGEVILMRGLNCYENEFTSVLSYIADEEEAGQTTYHNKLLGAIHLASGPHENDFYDVSLYNSDMGIRYSVTSQDTYKDRDAIAYAAYGNTFTECYLNCEIALVLSDSSDEWGSYGPSSPGGDMSTGSDKDVFGEYFDACLFACNVETDGTRTISGVSHQVMGSCFCYAGREVSGTEFNDCSFYDFNNYVINESAFVDNITNTSVPVVDTNGKITGLSFSGCLFHNNDGSGNEIFPYHTGNTYDYTTTW